MKIKNIVDQKTISSDLKGNPQNGWKYLHHISVTTPKTQPHTYNPIQLKNGQRFWIDVSPKKTYRCPRSIWKGAQNR